MSGSQVAGSSELLDSGSVAYAYSIIPIPSPFLISVLLISLTLSALVCTVSAVAVLYHLAVAECDRRIQEKHTPKDALLGDVQYVDDI
jgi:hypothetical protein